MVRGCDLSILSIEHPEEFPLRYRLSGGGARGVREVTLVRPAKGSFSVAARGVQLPVRLVEVKDRK